MGNYIVDPKFNDPLFGPICASFLFQLSFATTSTTIVSGAMAERYGTKAVGLEGGAGWPSTAAVTTVLASMGGGLVGLGFSLNNPKGIDILSQINGILGAFGALVAVTANSSCPSQAVLNRYSEEDIFKVSMIDRQHPVSRSMDFCILKYIIYKTDGAPVHIHVSLWRYSSCKLYMKLNHTRVTHKGQLFTMFTCQANSSCPSQAVLNRYSEEDIFKVSMIDRQHPVSRSMDFCILKYIIYNTDGAPVHIHVSL
uniref:Uncharacterized protein n=1 Tax=Trichogramma kaykai TaxID=54128 RepID=A0ABD2VVA0_9HYME